MPIGAFLRITGRKQGEISGSVDSTGRENSILVRSFSHEIVSPRDPASGLPTGSRQHRPILILVEIDKYSPLLWKAFVTNETLIAWELQLWKVAENADDAENEIYSIRLTNASIASIRESMIDNEDSAGAQLPPRQEITFTYQKIEWMWTDSDATAQDDWESVR
jgi:type VI secretion system secreted protein Hcp